MFQQVLYYVQCLAVDTINGLDSFAWLSELRLGRCLRVQRVAAQRVLLSRLCRQDIHRCGARPDGMYIWDRGRRWRQRDKDRQRWRGTRTRARHRPVLSYVSVAMCAWHLASPRLSIDSLRSSKHACRQQRTMTAFSFNQPQTERWKRPHDRAPVRSVKTQM